MNRFLVWTFWTAASVWTIWTEALVWTFWIESIESTESSEMSTELSTESSELSTELTSDCINLSCANLCLFALSQFEFDL